MILSSTSHNPGKPSNPGHPKSLFVSANDPPGKLPAERFFLPPKLQVRSTIPFFQK